MADIEPIRALRYEPAVTGGLEPVIAPPYDVIDERQRAELAARSPYNVVRIDLPQGGDDRYQRAATLLERWRREGAVVLDDGPAVWVLEQRYAGPDGLQRTRRGFLARVRVREYGPGSIRPHERTHPGPREDRLRLTRATKANLSPIFSLYSDPAGDARAALELATAGEPWAQATDAERTHNRLWRVDDGPILQALLEVASASELLIADGHHRYETARAYAEEVGGEGPHRWVLMCLVALEDPGLTVFPTHRLLALADDRQRAALRAALMRDFVQVDGAARAGGIGHSDDDARAGDGSPGAAADPRGVVIGYLERGERQPRLLALKDQRLADAALAGHAEPYRRLDTAVLEALVLRGALGMRDADIDHMRGLTYIRERDRAIELVAGGEYDAGFLMSPIPVAQVRAIAAAGESMPPKSTYFYPKVPTGLLFYPLA
ncbi:MAG TPA: DUF1015 domain-containing protein [Solirubrobacteraceae bacterium]|nr:DUF1015 domain-containing protein [Solirubrobacteraceae bacterium]